MNKDITAQTKKELIMSTTNNTSAELVLNANNDRNVVVVFDSSKDTLRDILNFDDVIEFFDAANGDEVVEHLKTVNGSDITAMKEMLLSCVPGNGYKVGIDLEAVEPDETAEPEEGDPAAEEEENPVGTEGFVLVKLSGGLTEAKIVIQNGKTTVHEAIFNDVVRAKSGMCDTQLSNMEVALNGEVLSPAMINAKTLVNGDVIVTNVPPAHTKGQIKG